MNLPMPAPRPGPGPGPGDWVPVDACTLPTAAQPLRLAAFDDLFASALRSVERPDASRRARLLLAGDEGLAGRVRRLAEAESACCSFFTFTLTPLVSNGADDAQESVLALDIEVPVARADVLAALVQRAEQVRRAAA